MATHLDLGEIELLKGLLTLTILSLDKFLLLFLVTIIFQRIRKKVLFVVTVEIMTMFVL